MEDALFHGNIVSTRRTIYTPTAFAKSSLLYLQEIGSLKANQQHTSKRNGLESFLFFFINEGSGELNYEGEIYHLNTGDCVFIYCANGYSHTTSPELWNISWIHFNGSEMLKIYDKYLQRGGAPIFHSENIEKFKNIWESTYEIANSTDYLRDMRINQYLSELLSEIMVYSWKEKTNKTKIKQSLISEIKLYIDKNFEQHITLDELSNRFYINKYHLLRLFKGHYGVTISEYIQQLRISKAKNLLRFTDKKIGEIGNLCGFQDNHYFTRAFQRIEGISPSEYKAKW